MEVSGRRDDDEEDRDGRRMIEMRQEVDLNEWMMKMDEEVGMTWFGFDVGTRLVGFSQSVSQRAGGSRVVG